jgi:hypothetical protein
MDNLLMDGFTHYETDQILTVGKWTAMSGLGTVSIEAGQGRNGNGALQLDSQMPASGGSTTRIRSTLATTGPSLVMRFAWAPDVISRNDEAALVIYNSEGDQIRLSFNADYGLSLRRGSTVVDTSVPGLFTQGLYGAVKVVLEIGNSAPYAVYVDDWTTPVMSGTADLQQQATASWTGIAFTVFGLFLLAEQIVRVSDLIVGHGDNTDMPNDLTIITRLPDGDGADSDLTPSTGSDHYALVDEVPPSLSDYVSGNAAGQKDTYTFAALGATGAVHAVQSVAVGQASIAGARALGMRSRIGGTPYVSAGQFVSSALDGTREIHPVSPATSTAWTVAEINGAEFGPQVTV